MNSKIKENKIAYTTVLVIAVSLFFFEQSPLNEVVRVFFGLKTLDTTGQPLLVGLVVLLITLCVELTTSFFTTLALHTSRRFKGLLKKFNIFGGSAVKPQKTKNSIADYFLALGVGAGTVVIKRHFKYKKLRFKDDIKSALKASIVIACFSGFVAFLAGGGIRLVQRYGLGVPAQYFLDVTTDWRFWLVVVVVSQVSEIAFGKLKKARD